MTTTVSLDGLLSCLFLDNPAIDDETLIRISRLGTDQPGGLFSGKANRNWVHENEPTRKFPEHQLAVAMLSALTGIDPDILSWRTPELGLWGTSALGVRIRGLWPRRVREDEPMLAVVLHDVCDLLRAAGVSGINRAVFGVEGSFGSAMTVSWEGRRFVEKLFLRLGCCRKGRVCPVRSGAGR